MLEKANNKHAANVHDDLTSQPSALFLPTLPKSSRQVVQGEQGGNFRALLNQSGNLDPTIQSLHAKLVTLNSVAPNRVQIRKDDEVFISILPKYIVTLLPPSHGHDAEQSMRFGGLNVRFINGNIPSSELCCIGLTAIGKKAFLLPEAAAAFRDMQSSAAKDGVDLKPSGPEDGYRSLAFQKACRNSSKKHHLGGVPGKSMHGYGFAVDIEERRHGLSDDKRSWIHKFGPQFGFAQPSWALPNGSKPEPWHYEYVGRPETISIDTSNQRAGVDFLGLVRGTSTFEKTVKTLVPHR